MGLGRLELPTSRLSGVRSSRLSYRPRTGCRADSAWPRSVAENRMAGDCDAVTDLGVTLRLLPRKEVIQPQVPLRLPCYDFTPVIDHSLGACLPCGLA